MGCGCAPHIYILKFRPCFWDTSRICMVTYYWYNDTVQCIVVTFIVTSGNIEPTTGHFYLHVHTLHFHHSCPAHHIHVLCIQFSFNLSDIYFIVLINGHYPAWLAVSTPLFSQYCTLITKLADKLIWCTKKFLSSTAYTCNSLFGIEGAVNYDYMYIVTNNINTLLIGLRYTMYSQWRTH